MNTAEQARQRALQAYLLRAVMAAQDDLAPELIDMAIGGNSEQEIDQSIEVAKAKSAALVHRMLQVQPVSSQAPAAANVRVGQDESDAALAQRVAGMSLSEWSRNRNSVLGIPSTADFLGGGA